MKDTYILAIEGKMYSIYERLKTHSLRKAMSLFNESVRLYACDNLFLFRNERIAKSYIRRYK